MPQDCLNKSKFLNKTTLFNKLLLYCADLTLLISVKFYDDIIYTPGKHTKLLIVLTTNYWLGN